MDKFVYAFNEGSADMVELLGAKGANLADMTRMGLPVPFGFTVTTEAYKDYYENDKKISAEISVEIAEKLAELEEVTGRFFEDEKNPLVLSVRPGAAPDATGSCDSVLDVSEDILGTIARIYDSCSVPTAVSVQVMAGGAAKEIFTRDKFSGSKVNFENPRLSKIADLLEHHYRDMQRMEFTVDRDGRLFILQSSRGQRSSVAAVRIACDLANEGIISRREALMRVSRGNLEEIFANKVKTEHSGVDELLRWADDERNLSFDTEIYEATDEAEQTTVELVVDTPRKALMAADLALSADMLTFDLDSLTTLIYGNDPAPGFDPDSVGKIVRIAAAEAKAAKASVRLGFSGKLACTKQAVVFAEKYGIVYISCEDSDVPYVKLAAAQAAIAEE